MLVLLSALAILQGPISTPFDDWAQSRNLDALRSASKSAFPSGSDPWSVLRTGGVYGTGEFGWKALSLPVPDGREFVVFSTPLTVEDIGELVFERSGNSLIKYLDERDDWGWSIEHHDLSIKFDIPKQTAFIRNTIRLSGRGKSRFALLRLAPNYTVRQAVNDRLQPISMRQAGGCVLLTMPAADGKHSVTIEYDGVLNRPQFSSTIISDEVLLTNGYWYPSISRKPSTFRVKVTAPIAWTTVSQGELLSESTSAGQKETVYSMELPVSYFSLSSGLFKTASFTKGGRNYFVASKDLTSDQMLAQAESMPDVLEFFERWFSKYPFTRAGAVVSEVYGSGALEAYSYATYGKGWLPDVEPHEPSHTWWGGLLNNSYLNSMWNESFAVWSEGFYGRNVAIGNQSDRRLAFITTPQVSLADDRMPAWTAGAFAGPIANSLGYGRGAYVLQMLEQEVGTDKLVAAMRRWIKVHPKGSLAEWSDFERVFNQELGKDYGWFFDQWLKKSGIPKLKWGVAKVVEDGVLVPFQFEGTPYRMTVEALVVDNEHKRSWTVVQIPAKASGSITIPATRALAVTFDPWNRLLRRRADNESVPSLVQFWGSARQYSHPKADASMRALTRRVTQNSPENWDDHLIVGHPDDLPEMKPLLDQVGFRVQGQQLTYDGTTIDLKKGAAFAMVRQPNGKWRSIGLGKVRIAPQLGRTQIALVDELGRLVRGKSEPKTSGDWTVDVPR
jgi:hypothetical protein